MFKTFVVETGIAVLALFYALFGLKRSPGSSAEQAEAEAPRDAYAFSRIKSEIIDTINRLEDKDGERIQRYVSEGDGQRLFDGLYSSLLYASSAAVTGSIDRRFYGNLMEWDSAKRQLRVRFFTGTYNDEIITRSFPVEGRRQGVASEAFKTGEVQLKNVMDSEVHEKGETRLAAMVSVPILDLARGEDSRQIVILNIDSVMPNTFPTSEKYPSSEMKNRVEELRSIINRVNRLYRTHMEDSAT